MSRLKAQQALVALRARQVREARGASAAARYQLLQAVRRTIASPGGLATAFVAGYMVGARRGRTGDGQPSLAQRAKRLLVAAGWLAQQARALQSPHAPLG